MERLFSKLNEFIETSLKHQQKLEKYFENPQTLPPSITQEATTGISKVSEQVKSLLNVLHTATNTESDEEYTFL